MFNKSKYTKWYLQIMQRAELRTRPKEYCEKHHKIPKSVGGSNAKNNLVVLTAREHILAHYLLSKMMIDKAHILSMSRAFAIMSRKNSKLPRGRIPSHILVAMRKASAKSSALKDPKNRFNPANCTQEYRDKMAKASTGKAGAWRKGAKDTDESRLKKSIAGKKKIFSAEHRANLTLANTRKREQKAALLSMELLRGVC